VGEGSKPVFTEDDVVGALKKAADRGFAQSVGAAVATPTLAGPGLPLPRSVIQSST